MNKKTKKIALTGMFSALSVVIMLFAYFPYATYALPAIAGVLLVVVNIEAGYKWAVGGYIVAALISLAVCEKESATLYLFLFGYYPILKGFLESHIKSRVLEYVLKIVIFNISVVLAYIVIVFLFGIPMDETGEFGEYFVYILLLLGNIVFVLYDIGLSRLVGLYIYKYHEKISKLLKR